MIAPGREREGGENERSAFNFLGVHRSVATPTRGLDGIGSESEPAFDRTTGVGFVAPYAGDYRGRAPHVPLTLVHSETTDWRSEP